MLVIVARTGSIGRAAAELGSTQPSVGRRIAALERTMQIQLLQRGPRGSVLTPTGRVVVGWAETLLASSDHFSRSVQAMRNERAGAVRVAVSMTIAEHLAPIWLARMRDRSVDTAVSLAVDNSTRVAEAVENGTADIGFVESPTVRGSLRRRRLAWDALAVAVRPDHLWADGRSVSPAELAAEPLLVREVGSGTRETLDDALSRHGLTLTTGLTLASNAALKSSALAGIGPVVLSELALNHEFVSGQLVRVAVSTLPLRRPLTAVWLGSEQPSPAAIEFLKVAQIAVV